jgi:hypothetical protein
MDYVQNTPESTGTVLLVLRWKSCQFHTRADLPKAVSLRSMPVRSYAATPSLAERPHRALRTGLRGRERSARLQGQAHEVHSGAHSVDPRCHQGRTRCELSERACRWDRSYPPTAGEFAPARLPASRPWLGRLSRQEHGMPMYSMADLAATTFKPIFKIAFSTLQVGSKWEASAALLPST